MSKEIQDKIDALQKQKVNTGGHGRRARIQAQIDKLRAELDDHHYFASFALGWATAETREAAIEKLVAANRSDVKTIVKNILKQDGAGMYIWSCKVHAPADDVYDIEYYAPHGVDVSDGQEHFVTYVTDKAVNYYRGYEQEAKNRRSIMEQREPAQEQVNQLIYNEVHDLIERPDDLPYFDPAAELEVYEKAYPKIVEQARENIAEARYDK